VVEGVAWAVLGLTTLAASLWAHRDRRARLIGRWAVALLFVVAGAGVNAWYLATGIDYAAFADASVIPFVRDTWRSVVAPNQGIWIGLLVAFEAVAGVLVASGGRRTQVGLVAIIGFHVALLAFGPFFAFWSLPMLLALVLLLRAERQAARSGPEASDPRHAVAETAPAHVVG
jgi:hypothetical protein